MRPRVLLSLPMFPFDPANGAAQSQRTIAQLLAGQGFAVHVVATTVSAQGSGLPAMAKTATEAFGMLGLDARRLDKPHRFVFTHRGVTYEVLDTGRAKIGDWEKAHGRAYSVRLRTACEQFAPDVLFTFTASAQDQARAGEARRRGVRHVFALRHSQYLIPELLRGADAILTPSRFMSGECRAAAGVESTAIRVPLDWEQVLAPEREAIFFTIVNPVIEKGLMLTVRLADELGRRRPDIPLLVIESRGGTGQLIKAAEAGGIDLTVHENLMVSGPVASPRHVFTPAKVLLMPSIEESAGRAAAEAMVNGVPPVVSDRGGLPETVGEGGIIVPLPAELTKARRTPVDREVVEPWLEWIERLEDDSAFLEQASARARAAAQEYSEERLAPQYAEFFESVASRARRA